MSEMLKALTDPLRDGTPSAASEHSLRSGSHKELLIAQLMGKHYEFMRAGKVFIHSSVVAGVAFPISTTTAPVFGVWNKLGSGKLVVPLLFTASYVSGTAVQTGVGLSLVSQTGSGIATGLPIAAATEVSPVNALLGLGDTPVCKGFSAVTLTTAGIWTYALGLNTFTGAATVPVGISPISMHDFHGCLGIPPGNFVYTVGNAASSALYQQTLVVAEISL